MQVVQVRGKAKSFDGPFDILLDVGGRIGHSALTKHIETTLWSDCDFGTKSAKVQVKPNSKFQVFVDLLSTY